MKIILRHCVPDFLSETGIRFTHQEWLEVKEIRIYHEKVIDDNLIEVGAAIPFDPYDQPILDTSRVIEHGSIGPWVSFINDQTGVTWA